MPWLEEKLVDVVTCAAFERLRIADPHRLGRHPPDLDRDVGLLAGDVRLEALHDSTAVPNQYMPVGFWRRIADCGTPQHFQRIVAETT